MQHTFGLETAEIGGEEWQGGYNGFREVDHGELILGAARWNIFFTRRTDQSQGTCAWTNTNPNQLKIYKTFLFFIGRIFL